MAKTIYHSELAKLGDVLVTVTSDVQPSKYSKPGVPKPNWVGLRIDGEDRTYNIESDACEKFFAGRKGQTLRIQAFGSREEATIVECGPAEHPDPEPPAPDASRGRPKPFGSRQPDPETPAGAMAFAPVRPIRGAVAGPEDGLAAAKAIVWRAGNLWGLAAKSLNHQLGILNADPATAWIPSAFAENGEAIQAAIATICIQSDRAGVMSKLPCAVAAPARGTQEAL